MTCNRHAGRSPGGIGPPAPALPICLLLLLLATPAAASAAQGGGLGLLQAAVLGVVEGATEYLPVSSTGHLLLAQRLMGIGNDGAGRAAADAYAIVIQAGAILAVLGLYRRRVAAMFRGLAGRDPDGLRLALRLVIAFLPAAIAGLGFEKPIKGALFGLWPVTAAWLAGGMLILAASRRLPIAAGVGLDRVSCRQAAMIGIWQCLALWPGVSRSLATILGGLLAGVGLAAAVEFSFLLGLLTLGAATLWESLHSGALILSVYGWASALTGFACALGSAWLAVRWMVSWLQRRGLAIFGWYRIVLGLATALLLLSGGLPAG
jgi:undecaprenyl-diphosphatase